MEAKVEELQRKVAEHFEDQNDQQKERTPIIKAPIQPTREQWDIHQITHTPYAPWRPHCVAARAVRRGHPSGQSRAHVVPDTDSSRDGPATISMDYMYMHDRVGKYKDSKFNPPYLVAVEHRYGRVWAYQVQNKGHMDGAHRLP